MAIDTYPHLSFAFGGTLGTPALEIWSCSLKLVHLDAGDPAVIPFADQETLLQEYKTAAVTWFTAASASISQTAKMTWAKLNSIGANGKYFYPNTTVDDFTGPQGAMATIVDWRQSLCITMRGASSRGKASTGRFYPPTVGLNPETVNTPYISSSSATTYAGAAKTFLDALNAADITGTSLTSAPFVALVAGADTSKPGSAKVWNQVTYIEVDRVNDSQRRRTNSVARNAVATNLA